MSRWQGWIWSMGHNFLASALRLKNPPESKLHSKHSVLWLLPISADVLWQWIKMPVIEVSDAGPVRDPWWADNMAELKHCLLFFQIIRLQAHTPLSFADTFLKPTVFISSWHQGPQGWSCVFMTPYGFQSTLTQIALFILQNNPRDRIMCFFVFMNKKNLNKTQASGSHGAVAWGQSPGGTAGLSGARENGKETLSLDQESRQPESSNPAVLLTWKESVHLQRWKRNGSPCLNIFRTSRPCLL